MIPPQNIHPDYDKNVKKLTDQGFRGLTGEEYTALPFHMRGMGGPTILVNAKGEYKSVSHSTGMVADQSLEPPQRRVCKGLGPKPKR